MEQVEVKYLIMPFISSIIIKINNSEQWGL